MKLGNFLGIVFALGAWAQTQVKPRHIREWVQVFHPCTHGTAINWQQVALDPIRRDSWRNAFKTYDAFAVAMPRDEYRVFYTEGGVAHLWGRGPILIYWDRAPVKGFARKWWARPCGQ